MLTVERSRKSLQENESVRSRHTDTSVALVLTKWSFFPNLFHGQLVQSKKEAKIQVEKEGEKQAKKDSVEP